MAAEEAKADAKPEEEPEDAGGLDDDEVLQEIKITFPKDGPENAIGKLGNVGYLRNLLPKDRRIELKANKLYWLTDRTPHEGLPMIQDGWRQFFRLVSHKLGVWYEEHSTKNPVGIIPDESYTKIIEGNKFDT